MLDKIKKMFSKKKYFKIIDIETNKEVSRFVDCFITGISFPKDDEPIGPETSFNEFVGIEEKLKSKIPIKKRFKAIGFHLLPKILKKRILEKKKERVSELIEYVNFERELDALDLEKLSLEAQKVELLILLEKYKEKNKQIAEIYKLVEDLFENIKNNYLIQKFIKSTFIERKMEDYALPSANLNVAQLHHGDNWDVDVSEFDDFTNNKKSE